MSRPDARKPTHVSRRYSHSVSILYIGYCRASEVCLVIYQHYDLTVRYVLITLALRRVDLHHPHSGLNELILLQENETKPIEYSRSSYVVIFKNKCT